MKGITAVLLLVAFGIAHAGEPAPSETAKADAARKKPLQRCDQLQGDAELACLKNAREGIVEARAKRQNSAKGEAGRQPKTEPKTEPKGEAKGAVGK